MTELISIVLSSEILITIARWWIAKKALAEHLLPSSNTWWRARCRDRGKEARGADDPNLRDAGLVAENEIERQTSQNSWRGQNPRPDLPAQATSRREDDTVDPARS
jgi:hypothetical protein